MGKRPIYPTMEERPPIIAKFTRFTKEEAREANTEFKDGASEKIKEIDGKISRSRNSESTKTLKCR